MFKHLGTEDVIELVVRERKRLRVGHDPLDLDSTLARLPLTGRKALRRQVGGDDVRARLGRTDRDVAGAGGDSSGPVGGGEPGNDDWDSGAGVGGGGTNSAW